MYMKMTNRLTKGMKNQQTRMNEQINYDKLCSLIILFRLVPYALYLVPRIILIILKTNSVILKTV